MQSPAPPSPRRQLRGKGVHTANRPVVVVVVVVVVIVVVVVVVVVVVIQGVVGSGVGCEDLSSPRLFERGSQPPAAVQARISAPRGCVGSGVGCGVGFGVGFGVGGGVGCGVGFGAGFCSTNPISVAPDRFSFVSTPLSFSFLLSVRSSHSLDCLR